ncbi:MAG: hypothetical protein ABSG16_07645, partial [Candidatus Acidiferrum sp.]
SEPSPLASGAWEVQAFKATQLAATWDAPIAQAPVAAALHDTPPEVAASPISDSGSGVENAPAEILPGDAAPREAASMDESGTVESSASLLEAVENPVVEAPSVETVTPEIAEIRDVDSPLVDLQVAAPETELLQTDSHITAEGASPYAAGDEPVYAAEPLDGEERAAQSSAAPTEAADPAPPVDRPASLDDLAAAVTAQAAKAVNDGNAAARPELSVTAAGTQAAANDDLVARVLASLSPEVMQAVTREILKPVVEAMVREELNKNR